MRRALQTTKLLVIMLVVAAWGGKGYTGVSAEPPLTPKSVPVQVRLAEAMTEHEDWEEAIRRWIDVLYYFGPSESDARAHFEIGSLLLRRGRSDLAASQWEKLIHLYPESEPAARARDALRALGKEPPSGPFEAEAPLVGRDTPEAERQFLVAETDFALGLLEFAIRDYLKVPNLYPESPLAPRARFQVGLCQSLLGQPELALLQWQRVRADYPEAPEAKQAAGAIAAWEAVLALLPAGKRSASATPRPRFSRFGSEPERGLSYAEDMYENGIVDYALQEYAKVVCEIYTPKGEENPEQAYARFWMGVCAYQLGNPAAAARQWQRLLLEAPESFWSREAKRALSLLRAEGWKPELLGSAPALPQDLSVALVARAALADQLLDCGLPLIASKEYLKVIYVLTAGRPNPRQAEAMYQLGVCHQRLGQRELAKRTWQEATQKFPETPWAKRAQDSLARLEEVESLFAASATRQEEAKP